MQAQGNIHKLKLTYEEYCDQGMSISNSIIDRYYIYDTLGKGAFASVFKGMNDKTKKEIAAKVLDMVAVTNEVNPRVREIRERLCRTEPQLMLLCNSENLIKCYDVYENKSLKILIMEYCNGGTLQAEIDSKKHLEEREAIMILKQILNGLKEMHAKNIIHRDLKAENIISHNGIYKIADFGFSKQLEIKSETEKLKGTTLGTVTTMAPEVIKRQPYGLKADIWSVGIMFFQMIFGEVPYTSTTAQRMYNEIASKKVFKGNSMTINGITPSENVVDFLKKVLVIDQDERIGWSQINNHPLFKEDDASASKLAGQFRMNIPLDKTTSPQIKLGKEEDFDKKAQDKAKQQEMENEQKNGKEIKKLPQQIVEKKKNEINKVDDEIFAWAKVTHLECQKTQLILERIIEPIQKNSLLASQNRAVVEFMYLLSTRCLNNMSPINEALEKHKENKTILNLQETVQNLYKRVIAKWQKYSKALTTVEDKIGSIILDKWAKVFKKNEITQKDNYLTGIEKIEYTVREQIEYTAEKYIQVLIPELKNHSGVTNSVKQYLKHYRAINLLTLETLGTKTFENKVKAILV